MSIFFLSHVLRLNSGAAGGGHDVLALLAAGRGDFAMLGRVFYLGTPYCIFMEKH
jgi:hypothetical protein